MNFEKEKYYHLYNRSNNREIVFRKEENFPYFLQQYHKFVSTHFSTVAYCLMPTHFHFLVKAKEESKIVNSAIGVWLSAYTKAVNKRYKRHGSLFQPHTKAKLINDESYIITLITYIHQNPVRAGLVKHCAEWSFSSYRDCTGERNDPLIDTSLLFHYFKKPEEYKTYADGLVKNIKKESWM